MNIIKEIFGRIFAVWALLIFSITLLVALIPIWIFSGKSEPKRSQLLHTVYKIWLKVFFVLTGVRRIFQGRENIINGQNYIVVCNHRSFMDVPLSSAAMPTPTKTIAKIEMSRIPLFGVMYRSGSVLVDRKNDESRKKSYRKMKEVLDIGLNMCIYPEGTRNKTMEPMQRFHDGAFRLSTETGKPILPAVILYTTKVLPPKKKFYFWPHRVEIHFLPAVLPDSKTAQQLKEQVYTIVKDYYIANNQ